MQEKTQADTNMTGSKIKNNSASSAGLSAFFPRGLTGRRRTRLTVYRLLLTAHCLLLFTLSVFPQNQFEDLPINEVTIAFEGSDRNISAADQFKLVAENALGERYSAVRVRDALAALYNTDRIVSAVVEASRTDQNGVDLRFVIKRKTKAEKVYVEVGNTVGDAVTEQELLLKLNLLNPGMSVTEQTLRNNADLILEYLRERGFFNAEVNYRQEPLQSETEVAVTFEVTPNAQATVESFDVEIEGFDSAKLPKDLKLKPGELFSREKLRTDIEKIRAALRKEKYLAPDLNDPRVVYDREKNAIIIELKGKVGGTVNVSVEAEDEKVGEKTQTRLLPIVREGTLDYAAIVEGSRRLRNYFQEKGYFFADVKAFCSVQPEFAEGEASETANETEVLCSALSGAELNNRVVDVVYRTDLNRKLKLIDIRLRGTDKLSIPEIKSVLESQEANILGFIPYFGYGRGYTSYESLEEDRLTIKALMRDLGYRNAEVRINQGVALNGEDLIITFVVTEGIPTRVESVEINGNAAFSDATLETKLPDLIGRNYSRVRARNGVRQLAQFYSEEGYYDAKVNFAIEEYPRDETAAEEKVKIVYTIENEGKKVLVNRILINGNEDTRREAILKAINLESDQALRAGDIFTSEQNLYATDAFGLVEIKPEPAGETPDGSARLSDVIINVEEQKPRLITYGGGYSTDIGANGFFDIRHFNLFGRLQQGGIRVRGSRLQQLVQIDYLNPRFLPDKGEHRFAPLTFTAQYQRDSTVTRFFRSAFDQGTFGIVQRVDENGNPIDIFGNQTGDPTINRFTIQAETSRTLSVKKRSLVFFRYKFEDVRLFNFESLLVKDLLAPDAKVRTSGFGVNFVYDTRENCNIKYTLLEIIAKGEPGEPCRYSATDPSRGNYITAEYNVSLPQLGANIGFHKFQISYNTYYSIPKLNNIIFAGRAILGLASVFSRNQDFSSSQFPDLEGILPISERFFAGGSTTLRGFDFESAGPRVAIVPQGIFRNSAGDPVFLDPFTIPFGGNALAIVNLEARIPLTEGFGAVPFYDGGNVFRRIGDIFNPPDIPPDDVFRQNLRALWTHTVGLGLRIKTPIGGEFGIDYGYLLNPPRFLLPQQNAPNAIIIPGRSKIHFRFSQAF
ncbi:MAG: POTRA domain-containing protein [Pyrinomonadaceae bacterium]